MWSRNWADKTSLSIRSVWTQSRLVFVQIVPNYRHYAPLGSSAGVAHWERSVSLLGLHVRGKERVDVARFLAWGKCWFFCRWISSPSVWVYRGGVWDAVPKTRRQAKVLRDNCYIENTPLRTSLSLAPPLQKKNKKDGPVRFVFRENEQEARRDLDGPDSPNE